MARYIAILRGINVGGKRKVLMADLKVLLAALNLKNIITYIQSGNVIFDTGLTSSEIELADLIEKTISAKYGFNVPVIVRSVDSWRETINNNSFIKSNDYDIERYHVTFLKEKPQEINIGKAMEVDSEDSFNVVEKDVFIYCKGKYHQTKLGNNFFEKKLKVSATTRNWNTILKLMELAEAK